MVCLIICENSVQVPKTSSQFLGQFLKRTKKLKDEFLENEISFDLMP